MEGAYVLGSPFVEDLVAAGQRGPSHPGGHPSVAEDTAVKGLWEAYVHWPGPRAASLKMWSPAEQSSQSHPGGHPPVAEDTAVKGLWAAYVHWPGARAASLLPDGGTILMSPVVCFLKDYGLWWGKTLPHGSPFVDDTECRGYSSGPPWRRGYLQYPGSVVPVDEGGPHSSWE